MASYLKIILIRPGDKEKEEGRRKKAKGRKQKGYLSVRCVSWQNFDRHEISLADAPFFCGASVLRLLVGNNNYPN
ncbi:hypothetical protein QUB60_12885 [Microcoleus sp. A2-C5]|uniref:hypothetical protein n=1 Tax=Microcoleaceae TaxID=1892252 RepID=UPI002238CF3B|nr:hypothetical protein [Lyngbya sp. CCAP 1446/10]MCW6049293.1 hypothetical protein [Lyngbya sp. CCAP 1446/10]